MKHAASAAYAKRIKSTHLANGRHGAAGHWHTHAQPVQLARLVAQLVLQIHHRVCKVVGKEIGGQR